MKGSSNLSERIQRILNSGVNQEQVNLMEHTYPLSLPDLSLYDELESEQVVVSLDKVKGGPRIDATLSWLENFLIMNEKIDGLLDSIEKDGLQQYIQSFQTNETTDPDPIELGYLDNLDSYFVISGGNHRITVAKMIGMKTIRTKVCYHKYSKERANSKSVFNWKRERLKKKIEQLGFWYNWDNKYNTDEINIYFKAQHIWFCKIPSEYRFYEGDIDKTFHFLNNLEKLIDLYSSLPVFLRSIVLLYIKRTDQKYRSIIENEFALLLKAGYFKENG